MLRFHYHKPKEIWGNLKDLSLPRTAFTSQMTEVPAVKQFITEDEIDVAMTRGSGVSGGKGRILPISKFHTDKEKVDFLRHEYGIGATPMPCQVLGAAGKIMTERACTTKKAAARMCISHGRRLPSGSPI